MALEVFCSVFTIDVLPWRVEIVIVEDPIVDVVMVHPDRVEKSTRLAFMLEVMR